MNEEFLTSRKLLEVAGISGHMESQQEYVFPVEYRHLLITSVLEFIPAHKLRKALRDNGANVSTREVLSWLKEIREWLGLPRAGSGKPSAQNRQRVERWRRDNGNPTLEEIDAGWVPADLADTEKKNPMEKLSPARRKYMKDLRQMIGDLSDETKSDEEFRELKEEYEHEIKKAQAIAKLMLGHTNRFQSKS